MFHPFDQPRNLTPEQWKARARAIQARLEGLSVDELMRGGRAGEPPHLGVRGPHRRGYDPSQPRVPAGHPDGGQWTDDDRADGGWTRLRGALQLAAAEGPPRNLRQLPPYLARKLIEAIHRELASWDLFGEHNPDKVTVGSYNNRWERIPWYKLKIRGLARDRLRRSPKTTRYHLAKISGLGKRTRP